MEDEVNCSKRPPILSAVVLNYRNYDQTIPCVTDLLAQDYSHLDIVIVDNHSPNESYQIIQAAFNHEERITVIQTDENLGYSGGNNFGCQWRLSKGPVDYFLISNNDIGINDRTVVRRLVEFACTKENLGGVGPQVLNARGFIQGPYKRPNIILRSMNYLFPFVPYFGYLWRRALTRSKDHRQCYAIVGAFMLLKASPFVEVGMFDTASFLGAEEYIIAEKLSKVGLGFYYFPKLSIVHNMGKSLLGGKVRQGWGLCEKGIESMAYYFRNYQNASPCLVALFRFSAMLYGHTFFRLRQYFMD